MKSHTDLIHDFVDNGKTKGRSSSMFIEGDILYSYGHHFPLLVRMHHWEGNGSKPGFLLNADKRSVTTASHQAMCFRHATIQIPFSALRAALESPVFDEIVLVDKEAERWDKTGRYHTTKNNDKGYGVTWEPCEKTDPGATEIRERRPESAVLKYRDKYYLSSMDGQNYFISLLPAPVDTVKNAFGSLIPLEVQGKDYKRQGEWFFIPVERYHTSGEIPKLLKWSILPSHVSGTGHHKVRDICLAFGYPGPLVRGTVRHTNRDHRMLKLGETWHVALESRHLGSWGASGSVD